MESKRSELAEKDGFSVLAKTIAVGDLNSAVSSTFDVGSMEQYSHSLSDAVGSCQQLGKGPMSMMPELANSYLHFSRSWQGPVNRPVRQHNEVVGEETGEGMQANSRDTIPTNQISLGGSTARENVRESGQAKQTWLKNTIFQCTRRLVWLETLTAWPRRTLMWVY